MTRRGRRAMAALPEPFPPEFRAMLDRILRKGGRIASARREAVRARHRALVQSGTFAGHRPYVRGDDLRRLDWNVYARTGSLHVKLLEEDERRATTVLVDSSPSMLAGARDAAPPRLCAALRLGAVIGGLSLQHLDGVHVRVGAHDARLTGRGQVQQLLDHLLGGARDGSAAAAGAGPTPTDQADALLQQGAPGKLHWISDFAAPAAFERALQRLRRAGHRVTGWLPHVDDDFGVEPGGWTLVHDPETGDELRVALDAAMCAALHRELAVLRRRQQQVFAACGFPLQRFRVPAGNFEAGVWLEAGWTFRR